LNNKNNKQKKRTSTNQYHSKPKQEFNYCETLYLKKDNALMVDVFCLFFIVKDFKFFDYIILQRKIWNVSLRVYDICRYR